MDKNSILKSLAEQVRVYLQERPVINYSLLGGDFGAVCFLYYYSRVDNSYEKCADELLQRMFDLLPKQPFRTTYCDGFAGLAIGLTALEKDGFVCGIEASLDEFDGYLYTALLNGIRNREIDFLHGIVGLGFYFTMRYKYVQTERYVNALNALVEFLYSAAIKSETIEHESIFKWKLTDKEKGREFNLSLSHGCASLAIMLCEMYKLKIPIEVRNKLYEMIVGVKNYLLSQELDPRQNISGSYFPNFSKDYANIQNYGSRLAWCYGDLGICVALLKIAEILQDGKLSTKALEILAYAAVYRRNLQKNYVHDAEICHGAAGVGQIFRSIYLKTNEEVFKSAGMYWHKVVLDMVTKNSNELTYLTYNVEKQTWNKRFSILEGISGIGLYLLQTDSFLNRVLILPT